MTMKSQMFVHWTRILRSPLWVASAVVWRWLLQPEFHFAVTSRHGTARKTLSCRDMRVAPCWTDTRDTSRHDFFLYQNARARQRVVSRRDVTGQVEFGLFLPNKTEKKIHSTLYLQRMIPSLRAAWKRSAPSGSSLDTFYTTH